MKVLPFKMKVCPEESEIVQKRLFELGYEWGQDGQEVTRTQFNNIMLESDGKIRNNSGKDEWFDFNDNPLITFQEFLDLYGEREGEEEKWRPSNGDIVNAHNGGSLPMLEKMLFIGMDGLRHVCCDIDDGGSYYSYSNCEEYVELPKKHTLTHEEICEKFGVDDFEYKGGCK